MGKAVRRKVKANRPIKRRIVKKCQKKTPLGTSTRDIVIRLDERVNWLVDKFKRHCARSWAVELAVITASIGFLFQVIWKVVGK